MCGIAGFSLRQGSKVNSRLLAHELLSAIEARGSHASGYAFISDDDMGVHKAALPGSRLPMFALPRRARTVILHTRFATQGKPQVNENNHPVISPDGTIALTHNGVISNDHEFRVRSWAKPENQGEFEGLPQVDSAVIPAIIEKYGVRGIEKLQGYAALAWLDETSKVRETLHLTRLDHSPVHYTWLADGSFVYASTEALLLKALDATRVALYESAKARGMGDRRAVAAADAVNYGGIMSMAEGEYFRIVNGWIMHREDDLFLQEDSWAKRRFTSATAGGKGSSYSPTYSAPKTTTPPRQPVTKSVSTVGTHPRTIVPQTTTPAKAVAQAKGSENEKAVVVFGPDNTEPATTGYVPSTFGPLFSDGSDTDWDDIDMWEDAQLEAAYACSMDDTPMAVLPETNDGDIEGYFLVTEDDNIEPVADIEALELRLEWYAQMALWDNPPFPDAEKKLRWVNFIKDLGHISKRDGMISWVEDLAELDKHESPAVYNLDPIRDGLNLLVGAKAI